MLFRLLKTLNPTGNIPPHRLICSENLTWLNYETETNNSGLLGMVDVCYLDPPYNTGNKTSTGFTYHDNWDTNTWLNFIRERLTAVKQFLKPTGVIVVSIDDSEVHYLRVLMDELYGRNNFIAQLTIDGGANKNNARFFSVTHEYMLVYANNLNQLKKSGVSWRKSREGLPLMMEKYEQLKTAGLTPEQITVEMRKWVKTQPFTPRLKKFVNADNKGLYTYTDLSVPGNKYQYDVYHPVTGLKVTEPSRGWGVNENKFKQLAAEDLIIWGADETKQPLKKLYLVDKKDQLMKSVLEYPSRSSTHLLERLLGERGKFNNPKNLQMMKDVLDYITPLDGVVMDVFGGTGTTAHAVLELNNENTLSNRRFIVVTSNENNIFQQVTLPRIEKIYTELEPPTSTQILVSE